MKKKLFALALVLATIVTSLMHLSDVSFAKDAKYVLSVDGKIETFDNAKSLVERMQEAAERVERGGILDTTSYKLTLNDDLVLPVVDGELKSLKLLGMITINGKGYTISGEDGGVAGTRLIDIKHGSKVTINNVILNGNEKYAGILGWAVPEVEEGFSEPRPKIINLVLQNSKIDSCYDIDNKSKGGAIYLENANFTMNNTSITNCKASNFGGAILLLGVQNVNLDARITNSVFDRNSSNYGGALYLDNINLLMDSTKIINCKASESGGAMALINSEGVDKVVEGRINNSIFDGNSSKNGGALCLVNNNLLMDSTKIINCKASESGGAILLARDEGVDKDVEGRINNSIIERNSALNGGGIYIDKGTMNLDNSVVNDNEAKFKIVEEKDEATGEIKKLITGKGAGLYINAAGDLENTNKNTITNTKFIKNKADAVGGGIYLLGSFYENNKEKLYTDDNLYNYLKKLPQYIKLNNATFKANTAGFGYYNPPYKIESIKTGPDAVSNEDYNALMSEKNSCRYKLIIKDANDKWQHIESLINNYDIDYINPITTTTYMENFGRNGIYVNEELETKKYQDKDVDANVIKGRDITVLSYEDTKLRKNPDAHYICWNTEKDGKDINGNYNAGDIINEHKGNLTLFAQWEKPSIALTLDENYKGGKLTDKVVMAGETMDPYLYKPKRRGHTFKGWSYNKKHLDRVHGDDIINEPTTIYAIWDEVEEEPEEIKGMTHKAYIFGYPDGTVRPNGEITRAEAAAMLARLLEIESIGSAEAPSFPDTPSAWYNKAINAVVQRDIMKGYPDGTFKPNDAITRAEFTQMISTIDNKPYGTAPFADVIGHWAERPIGSEYEARRIMGYPDGTFRPDAHITRSEAAVILNKIFERNFDAMSLLKCKNPMMIKYFTDLDASFWGYNELVEATNTHEYVRRNTNRVEENWLLIK